MVEDLSTAQCHLLRLSGDALAQIFSFVDDSSLPRLVLLSGCSQLRSKSASRVRYLNHNINTSYDPFYSPYGFIDVFRHLVALHVFSGPHPLSTLSTSPLAFNEMLSLPRSLVQLRLHFPYNLEAVLLPKAPKPIFESPFVLRTGNTDEDALVNFAALFPDLKVLELTHGKEREKRINYRRGPEMEVLGSKLFFASLPPGLESLWVGRHLIALKTDECLQIVAPNLHSLRTEADWTHPAVDLSTLPHLTYLQWACVTKEMASQLPHGLRTLCTHASKSGVVIPTLPPSLTKLHMPHIDYKSDSERLPKTLTSLRCMGTTNYAMLPNLRSLHVSGSVLDLTLLPADLESFTWKTSYVDFPELDLRKLPRKLTSLKLHLDTTRLRKFDALPPNLTALSLQLGDDEDLAQLTKHLRPSVTKLALHLRYISDVTPIEKLPPSLMSLRLEDCKVPEELVKHLYSSLHQLSAKLIADEARSTSGHLRERFLASLPPALRIGFNGDLFTTPKPKNPSS